MQKTKSPIVIVNWKDNVSDITEIKNLLKELDREYLYILKKKALDKKRKFIKKDLYFYLSLPPVFIYPIQNFLKENKNLKKIIIGAQNFDDIEKTNENNKVLLSQIISIGTKFVILNDENTKSKLQKQDEYNQNIEHIRNIIEEIPSKTNNTLLQRLGPFTKKKSDIEDDKNKKINIEELDRAEKRIIFKKVYEKEIYKLKQKVKASLENKMETVLIIKDSNGDTDILIDFIREIIKDIHYILFDKFTICYETEKSLKNVDRMEIENCQEKVIVIRRTVANMFGIDSAKKINIIYSGRINETNVKDIIENAGVDGILLGEETTDIKLLSKILSNILV